MKTSKYILSALAVISLFAVSCAQVDTYKPADKPTNAQVFFDQSNPSSVTLDGKANSFSVAIARHNAQGTLNVAINASGDGVEFFDIPTSVSFPEGSTTAEIVIGYNTEAVGYDTPRAITLSVADQSLTTPYGFDTYSFTASIPAPWSVFATAYATEGWWGEEETTTVYYQDMGNDIYKCYLKGLFDTGGAALPTDVVFTWNRKTNRCFVDMQYMGWDYDLGPVPESEAATPVLLGDWYHYFTSYGGYTPAQLGDADYFYDHNGATYPCSYYDGNGGFFFNMRYQAYTLGGWTPDKFDFVVICDGFVRKVYDITAEYVGMLVRPDMSSTPIVNFTGAADVVAIDWIITDQTVDPSETLAKILEGTSEEIVRTEMVDGEATEYIPVEPGTYRIVAVPVGSEGELADDHAICIDFYYPGASAEVPELEGQVLLTWCENVYSKDVCEANNLYHWNSAAYVIMGNEFKEAYYLLAKSTVLASYKPWTFDFVAANGSAISAKNIERINSGSYAYGAFMDLVPETDFTILIAAENVYGSKAVLDASILLEAQPAEAVAAPNAAPTEWKSSVPSIDEAVVKGLFGTLKSDYIISDSVKSQPLHKSAERVFSTEKVVL